MPGTDANVSGVATTKEDAPTPGLSATTTTTIQAITRRPTFAGCAVNAI